MQIESDFNTISGNIIHNNWYGIYLVDNQNNNIFENTLYDNAPTGIYISGSIHSIHDNEFIGELGMSIELTFCENSNIFNNMFTENNNGIHLRSAVNNSIYNNTILNCDNRGIWVTTFVYNNTFYHNYFKDNYVNAYDTHNNTWDNGYPSGGNSWGDYMGRDFFGGPNQDEAGPDGIGDIPYNIEGGAQDRYPLYTKWPTNLSIGLEEGERLTLNITNIGDFDATNTVLSVTIKYGFFILQREFIEDIGSIESHSSVIRDIPIFGIGLGIINRKPLIRMNVTCDEGVYDQKSIVAKIFLNKIII